ncbi:MAG: substrate-binding domain-containing protein [Chloroflexaceae bacterium]|nr:substrate-binding domain-containing protein [Chloroflexaceae bacterium]NJL34499.1 substrate-binding domain-containing protein [Chloroflexaceae bacterium]NJO06035.1 substrate-binding domain-containing protein [Chloroflexaceae bacterium]
MDDHQQSDSPRRVTAADVARALGVATSTVSNAYNRPDQLSAALRERVLATAAAMGYHPNPAARGLRRGRTRSIGVLYTDRLSFAFIDPAFVQFLRGVALVVEDAGLSLTLFPGTPQMMRDPEIIRAAVVDGFIIYSLSHDDPLVHAVRERRLPLVCVDDPAFDDVPLVGIEDADGAAAAAHHLLELGHRQIGVISLPFAIDTPAGPANLERHATVAYRVVQERLRGYRTACTAAGLAWARVPVEVCAENSQEDGQAAAARLLDAAPHLTALLIMSDRLALGALRTLAERGIRVPYDLSIAAFDDIPEAAVAIPPLTTLQQPHEEKGRYAGKLLMRQLEGDTKVTRVLLSTRLVVRGSTQMIDAGR